MSAVALIKAEIDQCEMRIKDSKRVLQNYANATASAKHTIELNERKVAGLKADLKKLAEDSE